MAFEGEAASIEHAIAMPDGVKLFAREYPALAPETGLPVLCLHGLTRNSRDFELVAPRIAALGRRTFALDVRGRGRSDRDPDPSHYQVPVYAQDVLRVLDALALPQAVFVGTSMGGLISMGVGAMAPARIAATVLNDVGPVLEAAALGRIGAYTGKNMLHENWAAAEAAVKATQSAAYPGMDEDFWRVFARRVCRELPDGRVAFDYDPAIAAAFATAPAGPLPDLSPLFSILAQKPVLVVRGALSDLLSREGVERMRALKPDLAVAEVPGVGHAPTLEEPSAWLPMVDFLARVP